MDILIIVLIISIILIYIYIFIEIRIEELDDIYVKKEVKKKLTLENIYDEIVKFNVESIKKIEDNINTLINLQKPLNVEN